MLTAVISALITAAFMLLAYEDSPHVWAHRALVAAEESHLEDPAGEYSKAFVEMQGRRKERKVNLVCRHPLSGQKVRYRMHTDPEGIVIKEEREDKTKSRTV